MQNEEELLDDAETVVELFVYDLWPSWLPVYVGCYLGAYQTGIAANNKSTQVLLITASLSRLSRLDR